MATGASQEDSSVGEVGDWLDSLGFEPLRPLFAEQEINLDNLAEIMEADLERWGVPFGSRKRLLQAIRARIGQPALRHATGAERRQITAVFCDMVGSTALAARLDPEDMGTVIGTYHEACRIGIEQLGGHVVRYIGDGVFGCFGWPAAHEDDPERAVHAGLAILRATRVLRPLHGITIQVRIGIATGLVVVGDLIGVGASQESSIVGETANLAARLQQVAAPDTIVLSTPTRRLLGNLFTLRQREPIDLKGIEEPVESWEVVSEAVVESRFAAAHGTGHSELLGREAELALLLRSWQLARGGEGQVVLLSGEPGIGKSRLAEAVCEQLRGEPHTRFRYQCSPFHANTPLYPVISQLERVVGIAPSDDARTRKAKLGKLLTSGWVTSDIMPMLADLVSASPDPSRPAGQDPLMHRQPMLEQLANFMLERAQQGPVLVLLEDAHWIDPTTRELLDRLSAAAHTSALLVLVTLRAGSEALWENHPSATRLRLNRLDRSSAIRIIEIVTGAAQLSKAVLERILEKTDGVPLFIEELTKAALDTGLATDRQAGGRQAIGGSNRSHAIDIPATLHDSLMARLDRLTDAKSVAQICAVIGRGFTYPLALTVTAVGEKLLDRALLLLVEAEILLQKGSGTAAVYTFRHALLQDAAYASLLRSRRQELHGRIGEALDARFSEIGALNPEVLAYHFTEAGRAESAIHWWHRAGQMAIRRSADLEATVHLRTAIELVAKLPEGPSRDRLEIDLRCDLNGPLFGVQGFTSVEAEANGERAWELCERGGGGEKAFLVQWGRSQSALTRGDMTRALVHAERLEQIAGALGGDRLLAWARRGVGITRLSSGDLRGALAHLRTAIDLLVANPEATTTFAFGLDPLSTTRAACALALQQLGQMELASEAMELALREAGAAKHSITHSYVLFRAGMLMMFARRTEGVGRNANLLLALGRTHDYASWTRFGEMQLGWHMARSGGVDEGLGRLHDAIEGQRDRGAHLFMPFMMVHEAELMVEFGRPSEALARLAEAEGSVHQQGQYFGLAELHRVRALALAAMGADAAAVDASLATAQRLAAVQGALHSRLRIALDALRIHQARGVPHPARHELSAALAAFPASAAEADLLVARALLASSY